MNAGRVWGRRRGGLQGRWTGECGAESSPILNIPIVGNCSKISGGWQFGRNTKRSLLSDTAEILSGAFGSGALFYRGTVAVFYQGLCPTACHVSSSGTRVFLKKEVQCQHVVHLALCSWGFHGCGLRDCSPCAAGSECGRQIPAAAAICVRRSPWVGFRSIRLGCRMVR